MNSDQPKSSLPGAEPPSEERPPAPEENREELQEAKKELIAAEKEVSQQAEALQVAASTIQAERQRYQELFESAPVGYLVTDGRGGIREANFRAAVLLGSSQAALVGRPLSAFITPENQPAFRRNLNKLNRPKRPRPDLPLLDSLRPDRLRDQQNHVEWETSFQPEGRAAARVGRIEVALTVETAWDEDGRVTGMRWLLRDLTERKRAENDLRLAQEARRASERLAQSTLDGLSAHIAILDTEGTILAVNASWRRYGEMNLATALGTAEGVNYLRVCDEARGEGAEDARQAAAGIRSVAARTQESFSLEYPCHSPHTMRWFALRVTRSPGEEPTRLITAHEDITERTLAEQRSEQLRSEAVIRSLILATANRVAQSVLGNQTGVDALQGIVEAAAALTKGRHAAIEWLRPGTQELMSVVTLGVPPQERAAPHVESGVLRLLWERKQLLRLDAQGDAPPTSGLPAPHPPMNAFLGIPVFQGETVLGILYLTEKKGRRAFTDEDVAAVQELGVYTGIAIQNLHTLTRQRDAARHLVIAQEQERRAIAYDLHDGLAQYVIGAYGQLQNYVSALQEGKYDAAMEGMLGRSLRYLQESVKEARQLLSGLRALELDSLSLAEALENLVREEKEWAGWDDAEFRHDVPNRRFDSIVQTAIYRVAQEALTNARKHARAARVAVSLYTISEPGGGSPQLVLEVRDWGRGFVPEGQSIHALRFGLLSMRERTLLLGGDYSLRSAPGEGTWVRAVFTTLQPPPEPDEAVDRE